MREIVVHYDELALKGKNISFFEGKLEKNLRLHMRKLRIPTETKRSWKRLFLRGEWEDRDEERIRKRLALVPGIANFGFVKRVPKEMSAILSEAEYFAKLLDGEPFRITAQRIDKDFSLNSREIEQKLGTELFRYNPHLEVDLRNFQRELVVKVLKEEILLYLKEEGIGGLPISSSGKAVSLISTGFDSPVATYLMMKRGLEMYPIHFHAVPMVSEKTLQTVAEITEVLGNIQGEMQLALIPILEVQRYIARHAPEKLRVVLLRRSFNRIASRYAESLGASALVTGESVGQVASQTVGNIRVTNEASVYPVLRPLVGMNKNEIIHLARTIGTAELSARPCDDTCSLFVPKHPETQASLEETLHVEEKLLPKLPELEEGAFRSLELILLS